MDQTRRKFIKIAGMGLGMFPVFVKSSFGGSFFRSEGLTSFSTEGFQGLVGTEFVFYGKDRAMSSTLIDVSVQTSRQKRSSTECFSLAFEMPEDGFAQGTFEVFHATLGSFDVFAVPGTSDKGKPLMIAVFNKI